ncbi:hypothetical protein FE257_010816 [Aspergillus nanangensis]|uniref:Heterokaryon incompatibility domain-containing protein n=1 Tax=Aspergillus nanangensis TaxID=2582783 RepID=A0AAD4GX65_ASPNN|nr:hypothetical protein FE257_010816 [Aspergillus nanangensis]
MSLYMENLEPHSTNNMKRTFDPPKKTSIMCETCLNLNYSFERGSKRLPYMNNGDVNLRHIEDFTKSAETCHICDFILQAISHFNLASIESTTVLIGMKQNKDVTLFFPASYDTIQIYTPIGHPPAWEGIVTGRKLSSRPDSQTAPTSAYIPTRLIDVGEPDDAQVRLVETGPLLQDRYIAVSYCWGTLGIFKTQTWNYEDMKSGIQIITIPQTIQDAIRVTRGLKIRYLWVDALCIIQDSASDWEIESSMMGSVYHNAHLTIAAATSESVTEGFLHQPHLAAENKAPFLTEWTTPEGERTILGARMIPALTSHTPSLDDETPPLWFRGWTLQESNLSRRVVTYHRDELWWSCVGKSVCECGTLDRFHGERTAFSFWSFYSIKDPQKAYLDWYQLIGEYTQRQLTVTTDRLPAISGIASVVQEITKSEYIAGLWSDNLLSDLAWQSAIIATVEDASTVFPLEEYRAPSFSWASIEHKVSYTRSLRWVSTRSCTVLSAGAKVIGQNPFGQVHSAHVTLRGRMLETSLEVGTNRLGNRDAYMLAHRRLLPGVDTALESFEAINEDGLSEWSVRRSSAQSLNRQLVSGTPVFLFYIGCWRGVRVQLKENDHRTIHAYLLLGKSPTNMSKYERIGIVEYEFAMEVEDGDISESLQGLEDFSEAVITIV